jgi:hypothetical protein
VHILLSSAALKGPREAGYETIHSARFQPAGNIKCTTVLSENIGPFAKIAQGNLLAIWGTCIAEKKI